MKNEGYIILSNIKNVFSDINLRELYRLKLSGLTELKTKTLAIIFTDYSNITWYSLETTISDVPVSVLTTRYYKDNLDKVIKAFEKELPIIGHHDIVEEYDLKGKLIGKLASGTLRDGRFFECSLNPSGELSYFRWNCNTDVVYHENGLKDSSIFKPITAEQRYISALLKKE